MKRDYNIYEFTELIRKLCKAHDLVNDFFASVYRLNDTDNICYPVVSLTLNSMTVNQNTIDVNLNLLYADRLTDNRDNTIMIQSTATSVLIELLNAAQNAANVAPISGYSITPYTEQFADNAAGAFTQVTIKMPNYIGECDWIDTSCIECL